MKFLNILFLSLEDILNHKFKPYTLLCCVQYLLTWLQLERKRVLSGLQPAVLCMSVDDRDLSSGQLSSPTQNGTLWSRIIVNSNWKALIGQSPRECNTSYYKLGVSYNDGHAACGVVWHMINGPTKETSDWDWVSLSKREPQTKRTRNSKVSFLGKVTTWS